MSSKILKTEKYLTEEEIGKLLEIIDEIEDKTLIVFTLETGLRRSEVVNILTSNIDYERQVVKIYDEKKNHWREVVFPRYVGSQLRMYLNSRKQKSSLLFPFCGRTANRRLKKWCVKAEIRIERKGKTRVSFHWLRHTFIIRSKMVGRDIKVVQQNTGDTIETILKYYRKLSIEDRIREVENKPILPQDHMLDGINLRCQTL